MSNFASYRLLKILIAVGFALVTVACGGSSNDEPTPTPEPTATVAPTPTEEPEEDDGIVRTAWNKTGDAGGWLWDRVSGAGSWIWGGVSGAGGWMWDRVTGLPGQVEDVFLHFWRWLWGTGLGEETLDRAKDTIETAERMIEALNAFSLSDLFWKVVRYIFYALLALLVVSLVLFKLVLPFLGGLPWRILGMARGSFQSGRPSDTPVRGRRAGAVTTTDMRSPAQPMQTSSLDDRREPN